MIIFAVRDERLLEKLRRRPIVGKFFSLRIEELDGIAEREVVDRTFRSFHVANGTSKETTVGRFSTLDDKTISYLSPQRENVIHDVGVSSGITSLDLYLKLVASKCPFKLFISDKFARFYWAGRAIRRIYDRDKALVRAYAFSVLIDRNLPWKYFVSRYAYHLVTLLPRGGKHAGELLLYDPRIKDLLRQRRIFEVDYDVFSTTLPAEFDLVRCMNLLNRAYFSSSKIADAVQNLRRSLREGGILQLGRTSADGTNNASFFRKQGDGFTWLEDVGSGYESKSLVT